MTSLDEAGVTITLSSMKTPVDPSFLHNMQKEMDRELIIALQEKIPMKIKRLKKYLRQANVDDVEFTLEYYDFLHLFTALLHWLQSRKPGYSSGTTLIASVQEEMYNTIATGLQICSKYFADAYAWMWKAAQTTHTGMAVAAYAPAGSVYPSVALQVPHLALAGGVPAGVVVEQAQPAAAQAVTHDGATVQLATAGGMPAQLGGVQAAHHPLVAGTAHGRPSHFSHPHVLHANGQAGGLSQFASKLKSTLLSSGFLKTACIWGALGCAAGAALMTGAGPAPPLVPHGVSQRGLVGATVALAAVATLASHMGVDEKRGALVHGMHQVQGIGAYQAGGSTMQYEVIATAGRPSFWLARLLGATPSGQQWWVEWFEDVVPHLPDGGRQYTLGGTQLIPVSAVFARRVPTVESVGGVYTVDAGTVQQLQSLHDDLVPHLGTPPQTPHMTPVTAAEQAKDSESSGSDGEKEKPKENTTAAAAAPAPQPVTAPVRLSSLPSPVSKSAPVSGASSAETRQNGTPATSENGIKENGQEKEKEAEGSSADNTTAGEPASPTTEPDAKAGDAEGAGGESTSASPRAKDDTTTGKTSPPTSPRSPRSGRKVSIKDEEKKSPLKDKGTVGGSAGSSTKQETESKGAPKEKIITTTKDETAVVGSGAPSPANSSTRRSAQQPRSKTDDVMDAITRGEKRHVLLTMLRLCHLALSDFHNNRETIFNPSNAPQSAPEKTSTRDFLYV